MKDNVVEGWLDYVIRFFIPYIQIPLNNFKSFPSSENSDSLRISQSKLFSLTLNLKKVWPAETKLVLSDKSSFSLQHYPVSNV